VRFGKEIQAAQKLEADLQLKRNLEARRLEKEEVARAKEKIRVKLGELSAPPPPTRTPFHNHFFYRLPSIYLTRHPKLKKPKRN